MNHLFFLAAAGDGDEPQEYDPCQLLIRDTTRVTGSTTAGAH